MHYDRVSVFDPHPPLAHIRLPSTHMPPLPLHTKIRRMSATIFPGRLWPILYGRALPIWRGSDEWGRHTIVIQAPWVGGVVIATRPCRCGDMQEFRCSWNGCPFMGMTVGGFCPTHDSEWLEP